MEEPKVIIKFDHVSFVCARSDKKDFNYGKANKYKYCNIF